MRTLLVGIAIFFGGITLSAAVLVEPLVDRTAALEAELHDLQATLRKARAARARRGELEDEHRQVGRELSRLERLLPTDPELDELTRMLRSLGADEVEVEVEVEPTVEHDLYFVVPVEVRLRGGTDDVLAFFHELSRVTRQRLAVEAAPQAPAMSEQLPPGIGRLLHTERFTMRQAGREMEATLLVHAFAMADVGSPRHSASRPRR